MKLFRKAICVSLASVMMLGLSACGSGKETEKGSSGVGVENKENKIEAATEKISDYIFRLDEGFKPSGIEGMISLFTTVNDDIYLAVNSDATNGTEGASTGDASSTDAGFFDGRVIGANNIARIYKVSKDGGNAELVYECPAEKKGDEQIHALIAGYNGEFYFIKHSSEGYTLCQVADGSVKEIGDAGKFGVSEDNVPTDVFVDKDGDFIACDYNGIKSLDSSLNELSTCTVDSEILTAGVDANGEPIIATLSYGETIQDDTMVKVQKLDPKTGNLSGEWVLDTTMLTYGTTLMKGCGGYDFFYSTISALYGYNYDGNVTTKIAGYSSSNINPDNLSHLTMINEKEFIMSELDLDTLVDDGVVKKFVKVDPSEVEDRTVITLTTLYSNDKLNNAVVEFNQSQTDVRVEVIDYSDSSDPDAKFSADISAGVKPDIYDISNGLGDLSIDQCINKGMIEDLLPYYENDGEIKPDDLIPSVFEAMKTDGKMYFVAPDAELYTLAAKKSTAGEDGGWTVSEMKEYVDANTADARMFESNNKMDNLSIFLSGCGNDFIDWGKGECSFNSQEFKDILEMCNLGSNEEMNWGTEDYKEFSIPSGSVLFAQGSLDLYSLAYDTDLFGGDIAFKGFPNNDKISCSFDFSTILAMSSQSEKKDAAWSFLRYFLTEEFQGKMYSSKVFMGFPTREDVYSAFVELNTTTKAYTDKYGKQIEPIKENEIDMGGFVFKRKPFTKEQTDKLRGLIDSAKGLKKTDKKVAEIINEEAQAYFAGDKSLDDTCNIIQDRVTTYVNESK